MIGSVLIRIDLFVLKFLVKLCCASSLEDTGSNRLLSALNAFRLRYMFLITFQSIGFKRSSLQREYKNYRDIKYIFVILYNKKFREKDIWIDVMRAVHHVLTIRHTDKIAQSSQSALDEAVHQVLQFCQTAETNEKPKYNFANPFVTAIKSRQAPRGLRPIATGFIAFIRMVKGLWRMLPRPFLVWLLIFTATNAARSSKNHSLVGTININSLVKRISRQGIKNVLITAYYKFPIINLIKNSRLVKRIRGQGIKNVLISAYYKFPIINLIKNSRLVKRITGRRI